MPNKNQLVCSGVSGIGPCFPFSVSYDLSSSQENQQLERGTGAESLFIDVVVCAGRFPP